MRRNSSVNRPHQSPKLDFDRQALRSALATIRPSLRSSQRASGEISATIRSSTVAEWDRIRKPLVSGTRRCFDAVNFAWAIPNHPMHGRVEYGRPTQFRRRQVKIHTDENFLLKSRRFE